MQYNQKTETDNAKKYLRNARKAILGRGGEISPTAGLKDLPEAIYKIPADASLAFQSDDTVAYRKIVPATAEEYAQIAKIGGMTYKCPVTNYLKITGTVSNQLSDALIINSDGSITILSGDPDSSIKGSVEFDFDFEAPSGDYYFFATGDDISEGVTVSIIGEWFDEDANNWDGMVYELGSSIHVEETHRLSQLIVDFGEGDGGYGYGTPLTFKLWLAKTTEGIFEGLRDIRVTELVSEGANLIPYPFPYKEPTTTRAGITFTDNGDGSITLNGKNNGTNHSTFRISNLLSQPLHLKAGTYIGSTGVEAVIVALYNGSSYPSLSEGCTLESDDDWQVYIQIAKNNTTVFNNTIVYPMMNYGMTKAPYKPYRADAVDTFTISAELRAFLEQYGYGRGVEGYPNYIDFERKVFVQNTYRKVFDGTENWRVLGTSKSDVYRNFVYVETLPINVDTSTISPMICNMYNTGSQTASYNAINGICDTHPQGLHFYDDAYNTSDISLWKAHLAELYADGNPLIVEYALAEPIEIDISAYLKDGITFLKVEGGGTITAVNEREQAVPSTINYIAKVGG